MFCSPEIRRPKAEGGSNPKPEARRPKEGRNPKAEGRRPNHARPWVSVFGFRPSAFFRPSGFGLQSPDLLGQLRPELLNLGLSRLHLGGLGPLFPPR